MKWLIKSPAPMDHRLTLWGDYHFARSLAKYLQRLGQEVDTDYDPQWNNDKEADVVLVLRGKHRYETKPGAINIVWNISHPKDISLEEYESYDLVFIASLAHAQRIAEQIETPVNPLLQCTDTEECYPPPPQEESQRKNCVFIGNSRDVERPGVLWAIRHGVPLKIWGNMWNKFVDKKYIMAKNLPGEQRGELYRKSRVTLNDHWPDMKEYGFINDRCFDALYCGTPVISDYHDELHQLFPDEILYYNNERELQKCFDEVYLNYPGVKARVDALRDKIQRDFSFEARARTFIEEVNKFRPQSKRTGEQTSAHAG